MAFWIVAIGKFRFSCAARIRGALIDGALPAARFSAGSTRRGAMLYQ